MDSATTTQDPTDMQREIDRLKADLSRLRGDFAHLAEDAVHAAKVGASEAKDKFEKTAKAAAAKGRESIEAVEHQVAAHPLIALSTAFAVGLVVGLVLTRSRD